MALSVTSNFSVNAGYASNNMRNSQTLMGKSINRISSGLKAPKPSDDIVSYVGGTKLKADSLGYNMLSTGVQDAAAKLNMADSVYEEVNNGFLELESLTVAYTSLSDKSGNEATQLKAAFTTTMNTIKNLVSSAQYKGENLFGTASTVNVYYGFNTGVALNINEGSALKFKSSVDTWLNLSTTKIKSASAIQNIINSKITARRVSLGNNLSALETISNYLSNVATAADAAYTAVTEVDMAREMTSYVKNNIQSQAAQAMVAQANQGLAQVLNLLQV